jgi:hypothetical protein
VPAKPPIGTTTAFCARLWPLQHLSQQWQQQQQQDKMSQQQQKQKQKQEQEQNNLLFPTANDV